jgi:signal transduction histidine kinase
MRFENFSQISFVYFAAFTVTCGFALVFIRINLSNTSQEAVNQFLYGNRKEISEGDTMLLATKLNAMTASHDLRCVSGKMDGREFVNFSRGECATSVFVNQVIRKPDGIENFEIRMSFQLPAYLEISTGLFIIGEIILFLSLLRINRQQIATDAKIKNLLIDLSSQVAHDIRSPISALNLAISTLSDEVSPAKLRLIKGSLERINQIANDLLKKGKAEELAKPSIKKSLTSSLKTELSSRPSANLNLIIDQILDEKMLDISQGDRFFKKEVGNTKDCLVAFDQIALARVLSNVINNALEAVPTDRSPCIELKSKIMESRILLSISDNGTGIPQHMISKLGKRGLSFGKSKNQSSGAGMGLYHAINTCKLYGAEFSLESNLGTGTTVYLNLILSNSNLS